MGENIYRDSQWRYHNDAAFRTAVDWLERLAIEHGFTPGELKQIAFQAALNVETNHVVSPLQAGFARGAGGKSDGQ